MAVFFYARKQDLRATSGTGITKPMFFSLSKILWFLTSPGSLILTGVVVSALCLFIPRFQKFGRRLLLFTAFVMLIIAITPVGRMAFQVLENRFPMVTINDLPEKIDGIMVLGGVINPVLSQDRGQLAIGSAVERITAMAELQDRYPGVKIIFSGGSGDLFNQQVKEADFVAPLLKRLGMDLSKVIFENQSRNTVENATNSLKLASDVANQKWLLVTSAFHMPRSVGVFRKNGWNVIPFPVDYSAQKDATFDLGFDLTQGLNYFGSALHEILGLVFYKLTGKTDTFLPAP